MSGLRWLWMTLVDSAHDRLCPCGFDSQEWTEWVESSTDAGAVVAEHRRLANGPASDAAG